MTEQLPNFDPNCRSDRARCICISQRTVESGRKIIVNPRNKKHVFYCAGQAILCSAAWLAVFAPDTLPILGKWKGGVVALC